MNGQNGLAGLIEQRVRINFLRPDFENGKLVLIEVVGTVSDVDGTNVFLTKQQTTTHDEIPDCCYNTGYIHFRSITPISPTSPPQA